VACRKQFQKILQKQGIKFQLNTKVLSASKDDGSGKIKVEMEEVKANKKTSMDVDVVLVAVGRRPVTTGLNLEKV